MSDDILEMLASSVAGFAKSDPDRARRNRGLQPGFDEAAWGEIAAQGWLSILVPEAAGGLGLGAGPVVVVAREFGRAALPEPFVAVGVFATACLAAADGGIWLHRLQRLMAGDDLIGVAWQAAAGGIDTDGSDVGATAVADGFTLRGGARFVAVPSAGAFLVRAAGAEAGLYWVPRDAAGLTIRIEACPDGTSLARLEFEDVVVPLTDRLAGGNEASLILRRALDVALLANAAELLGVMDSALDMTLDYLRNRKQFGVAIGSFQALQHRAVDLWIQKQVTEAAVEAAAVTLDDKNASQDARSAVASGAKVRAAQQALILCNQALQLHGAIGFADEYGLGLFLNRALTLSAWLGNGTQHRTRFAALSPFDARDAVATEVFA